MAKFQEQRDVRLANKEAKNDFKKALDLCTYLQPTKGDMPDIMWKYSESYSKSIDGASGGAFAAGLRSAGSQMLNKLELVDPFNSNRSFSLQTWQICIADPSTKKTVFYSKIKDSVKKVEEELQNAGLGKKFVFGCSGSKGLNALIAEMCNDNYKGAGLQIFDEFGEFIGIYEIQKKEAHLAFILRIYNGDGIDQFFKIADNQSIDKTVISFYTFSQVYTVLKFHQLMDAGFIQRFIWTFAIDKLEFFDLEECVKIWNDMNGDDMAWKVFLSTYNKYNNRKEFDPDYNNKLHFNNATAKMLLKDVRDYFKKIRHQFKYKDNLLTELAGKAATHAEKIAAIDQVLENEMILFESNQNKLFLIPSQAVDVSTISELDKFEVFPKNVLSAAKTVIKSMLFAVRLFHEFEPDENAEYITLSNLASVQQLLFSSNAVICPNLLNSKKIWHRGVPNAAKKIRLLSTNGTKILNTLCEYKLVKKFKICDNWFIYLLLNLDNINNIDIIQKMFKIYQRHGIKYSYINSIKMNKEALFEQLKMKKLRILEQLNTKKIRQNKPPLSDEEIKNNVLQFSINVQSTLDNMEQFYVSADLKMQYYSDINDLSDTGKNIYEICNPLASAKFGGSAELLDTTKKDILKYFPNIPMKDIKSVNDIPEFQTRLHKLGATISAIQHGVVFSPTNDYIAKIYKNVTSQNENWSVNVSFDDEKENDEPLAQMSNFQLGQLLQQQMNDETVSPTKVDGDIDMNNNHNKNKNINGIADIELDIDDIEFQVSPIVFKNRKNGIILNMNNNNNSSFTNTIDNINCDMNSMELDVNTDIDKNNKLVSDDSKKLDMNISSFIRKVESLKLKIDKITNEPVEAREFEDLFGIIEHDLCTDLLILYEAEQSLVLDKLSIIAQKFDTDTFAIARQLFIEYSSSQYEVFSVFVMNSKQSNMLPVKHDLEYMIQMLSLCLNDNTSNEIKSLLCIQLESKMTADIIRKILNYSYYRLYVCGDLSKKLIINWLKKECKSGVVNMDSLKNDINLLGKRVIGMTDNDYCNENNNKRLKLGDLDIKLLQNFSLDNCIVINLLPGPLEDLKKGKRIENRTKKLPHDINLVFVRSCKSNVASQSQKICFVAVMEQVDYGDAIQLDPDFTLKRYNNKNATDWWYIKELITLETMIEWPVFGCAYVYCETYKKDFDSVLKVLLDMKLPSIMQQMINKLSPKNDK